MTAVGGGCAGCGWAGGGGAAVGVVVPMSSVAGSRQAVGWAAVIAMLWRGSLTLSQTSSYVYTG